MTPSADRLSYLPWAVMMLLVGGHIRHPHHQPGHDGRDHIDRGVQRLRDQREAADGDADREFRRRHAGAGGQSRSRRRRILRCAWGDSWPLFNSPCRNLKAPIECAIATHLQQRIVANCSDSNCQTAGGPSLRTIAKQSRDTKEFQIRHRILAARYARVAASMPAPETRRAQATLKGGRRGKPGARCTRGLMCKNAHLQKRT